MNAEVAVFGFTIKPVTYTYKLPERVTLSPGQLVSVPFGVRKRLGVVVSITGTPSQFDLKEILEVKSEEPLLLPHQLLLAEKLSQEYFISQAEAIHLMLPKIPSDQNKLFQSINKTVKQELILFPTLRQAEQAQKSLGGLVFSHACSASVFSESWHRIQSGEAKCILGPRSALFAPFRNLKKITIFQTESDIYKEERRPYYRALQVARILAEVSGSSLQAVSYSPRIQDHFETKHIIKKAPATSFQIIDLRKKGVVNEELKKILSETKARKVLLFLNRRSDKGALVCRTCKERAYTTDLAGCPNCGSSDIKFQSFNLQTIAAKLPNPPSQAVYATQQIFFQETPAFDLIVVLSADTYFGRPTFDSSEKTFQMITNLKKMVAPKGLLVVQTGFPESKAIKDALESNYDHFYEDELCIRRETGFPPYSKLVKLTYSAAGPVPDLNLEELGEVFGPFVGTKFSYFVVRNQDLSPLAHLTRPWKLDIDPLSL